MDDELGAAEQTKWLHTRRGKIEAALTALCLVAIAVMLVVLLRGSGDGGSQRSTGTTHPTAVDSTTSTTLSPQAEVEQAYRDFHAMAVRLGETPDPKDPEIARRTTGDVRKSYERSQFGHLQRGETVRVGPQSSQTFLSTTVDGNSATLKVCSVDQSAVVDAETGAEIKAMRTVTALETATIVREEEGAWKISNVGIDSDHQWQGVYDCGA